MPKLYLTDTFVEHAKCPQDKSQEIFWDHPKTLEGHVRRGSVQGLGLRLTRQGAATFVHAYQFNGKRYRYALGSPPTMSLTAARMLVSQREGQITNGENPDASKINHRQKHSATVRDIIERYHALKHAGYSAGYRSQHEAYIYPWLKTLPPTLTRRGQNMKQRYKAFGVMFADRKLESIKPTDIEEYLQQFDKAGTYNKCLIMVSAMFTWAIRMQLVDMRNPCDPFSKRKTIRQKRDYSPAQIKAIAHHIFNPPLIPVPAITGTGRGRQLASIAHGHANTSNERMVELCNFMGILFLTMARPTELKHAYFEHFDLERLIWHKHNTKGIKLSKSLYEYQYRSVPIHPKIADLIRDQRRRWPNSKLVFPSPKDITQPRDNFSKPFERFRELDGVPGYFQLYDLKRIAISLMLVGQGVRREDVSHYVDHKGNLETTLIYDLGFVDPLRPVTDRLGQLLGV